MNTIKFNASNMVEQLAIIGKVISGKMPSPILESVKIREDRGNIVAKDRDSIVIYATNGEQYITTKMIVDDVQLDGEICVSFAWLRDLCLGNPNATITMTISDDLTLTAETIDGTTKGVWQSSEDFPEEKLGEGEDSFETIKTASLLQAIKCVEFARATDGFREQLQCVYLEATEDGRHINAVATDGRVFALKAFRTEWESKIKLMLPKNVINILATIKEHAIRIDVKGGYVEISALFLRISYPAVLGLYPNYKALIRPLTDQTRCTTNRQGLIAAFKRMQAMGNSCSGLTKLTFEGNSLRLESEDYDRETSVTESIPAFNEREDKFEIGCSSKIATGIISRLSGNNVAVYTTERNMPISFVGSDESLSLLMMPMHIDTN